MEVSGKGTRGELDIEPSSFELLQTSTTSFPGTLSSLFVLSNTHSRWSDLVNPNRPRNRGALGLSSPFRPKSVLLPPPPSFSPCLKYASLPLALPQVLKLLGYYLNLGPGSWPQSRLYLRSIQKELRSLTSTSKLFYDLFK